MGRLRRQAKELFENLIACDLERFEGRSLALIDREHRGEAWYSHAAQLRSIFERCAVDLAVDVGANEGQFARGLRGFYRGDMLSFEPVSAVFERLAAHAAADPRWLACPVACGSRDTTLRIRVSRETVFSSLLAANGDWSGSFGGQMEVCAEQPVAVRRLDALLDASHPDARRIFLKLDTQGYDMEAFAGLGERLRDVVALQAEVSLIPIYQAMPHWTESLLAFERAGFGVVAMFPVTRDRLTGRVVEFDCCLVRAGDAALRPYPVERSL